MDDYRRAAERAREAGFSGVELHAANGYLLEQALYRHSNRRQDRYGGGVEGRARPLLEVMAALTEVWPAGRVGAAVAV